MPRSFSYDEDHDFYERITKPLNLGDDGEIFVIDEADEDSMRPWIKPEQPHLTRGKSPEPPQEKLG